jgi:hypothetical protein
MDGELKKTKADILTSREKAVIDKVSGIQHWKVVAHSQLQC